MNTIQLECFVAVAEHLNFSRASEELKITQPAVSHQIQALEEELGVKLFLRTSKSVSLTQEGLMFFPDAQLILKTALSAKERLGRHEHFIPFDIGCHNYMELALLPPVLKQLSEEFPLLRPSMHLMPFPAMQGMVINQQLHAAFGIKDGHKKSVLNYRELCTMPVACVCSPDSPLAGHASLSKEDLSGNIIACSHRHISGSVFAVQNNILIGLPPEQRYFTENVESAFTLAKAQVGYTIYPDIPKIRDPELCYIPLKDVPELSFGVYYRRDDDHPVLKQFLRLMNRFFSENS
ncbi:LysR family transcriptional regulator [Merdimonas faecis]|uniref:LysR family transcriptional regulator n=1 Tax=Merdimonas faecis TaxID=1653435 RepID=UPI0022E595D0|nr:LysR family transcriptional regulator [Merdimonas faecis]